MVQRSGELSMEFKWQCFAKCSLLSFCDIHFQVYYLGPDLWSRIFYFKHTGGNRGQCY